MRQADLLPVAPSVRRQRQADRSLAVLIEVPTVTPRRLRSRPRSKAVAGNTGLHDSARPFARRSKRRLRREVRLAGCALLLMAPLVSACGVSWSGRGDGVFRERLGDSMGHDSTLDPGAASERQNGAPRVMVLAIEPAAVIDGEAAGVVPVVFPGYLLPDDTFEDVAHEGS
jgi:hypothetical protein